MGSSKLFDDASSIFPKGVNSPVRYFRPYPIFMKSGQGSRIEDEDGNNYIDYCLGFGPMILGHSNKIVSGKMLEQINKGILFGTPNESEIKLGKLIKGAIKSIEKMRFTNSGTEATMHAIRAARAYTKRKYILKMEGGFHGAHDYTLIKAGSGALTFGNPSSPGIPEEVSKTVLVGRFNEQGSIESFFKEMGNEIAAVITEPILGNTGVIMPEDGFLKFLREITDKYSSLLIFDEVITGFRFRFSGYQDIIRVTPDITTLGKIIGGGTPIGLFGGRRDLMDSISPSGNVYESGTFSGNPLSMVAGFSTLEVLKNSDYKKINDYTNKISNELTDITSSFGVDGSVNWYGSMFQLFFNKEKVTNYEIATKSNAELFKKMFDQLLRNGVYVPPSQFETNFVSFAHSDADLDRTIKSFEEAIKNIKNNSGN